MKKIRHRRFVIDLAGVRSATRLHAILAENLPLPEHYGRNLDAFYDVLTEFGPRWRIVFRNAGAAMNALRAVCEDAMAETPGLEILFEP
jgi:ribonuclease inhibitor